MELDKFARLLERLIEKTSSGEIKWRPAEIVPARFYTRIGTHNVYIDEFRPSGMSDPDYYLGFSNDEGERIDAVSDVELKEVMTAAFTRMRALFHSAQRSSNGVLEILDDVLKELDDAPPF